MFSSPTRRAKQLVLQGRMTSVVKIAWVGGLFLLSSLPSVWVLHLHRATHAWGICSEGGTRRGVGDTGNFGNIDAHNGSARLQSRCELAIINGKVALEGTAFCVYLWMVGLLGRLPIPASTILEPTNGTVRPILQRISKLSDITRNKLMGGREIFGGGLQKWALIVAVFW